MRMMMFSLVTCLFVLCGGFYVAIEKPEWMPAMDDRELVIVLLVENDNRLRDILEVANPLDIAARSKRGVAFSAGRIAAIDEEAASELINHLGWIDRRIEVLEPGMKPPAEIVTAASSSEERDETIDSWLMGSGETKMSASERREKLKRLTGKKKLSRGEQIFVMRAMADGLEP